MAYITIELFRKDFKQLDFSLFQRGFKSLSINHLVDNIYKQSLIADKVFIIYNGSELILKENKKLL